MNGGSCSANGNNGFNCVCPQFYIGKYCQTCKTTEITEIEIVFDKFIIFVVVF